VETFTQTIPAILIMLGSLIFVHEFGHFIVGKLFGIGVEIFSIGFGPKLFGWKSRDTSYQLNMLPLGGYVKFSAFLPTEASLPEHKGKEFYRFKLWKKALTVLAGPVANLLLAGILFTFLSWLFIPEKPALIGQVRHSSPAAMVGMQPEDLIVEIEHQPISTWREMAEIIQRSPNKLLTIKIKRDKVFHTSEVRPEVKSGKDFLGRSKIYGQLGIIYGRIPPIISVTDRNSFAYRIGLRTGDQVTKIIVPGDVIFVHSFHDLKKRLPDFIASTEGHQTSFYILRGKQTHQIFISKKERQRFLTQEEKIVSLETLGIHHSQLTIKKNSLKLHSPDFPLKPNDYLQTFGGHHLKSVFDLEEQLRKHSKPQVNIQLIRNYQPMEVSVPLKMIKMMHLDKEQTIYRLPVFFLAQPFSPKDRLIQPTFISALSFATGEVFLKSQQILSGIFALVTGNLSLKSLGGPILVAKVAGESARSGWQTFLWTMALISINLGVFNLLPIPLLDGGHLCLFGIEAAKRSPINLKTIENYQKIGFAIVFSLIVLVMYNDVSRYWQSMIQAFF